MSFSRALRTVGGAVCAGALLCMTATPAAADETRDLQWALDALDADKTWKVSTGKGVTVAVIDSGVDSNHADLRRNVLEGKNFSTGDPAHVETNNNHGTAMASIIAGHGHGAGGSQGVMGIAPDAKILPVKQSDKDIMDLNAGSFAEPLRFAVDQGVKIVNMSFGKAVLEPEERAAIAYAAKNDVLLIASSGNAGTSGLEYPGAAPGVVTVGAVDKNQKIWEKSSYGEHLMLTAPGVGIETASVTEPYRHGAGTSDATAYVSGAAALIRAEYPDLTAGQVANRLVKTAKRAGSATETSPDPKYGYGIIQPYEALTADVPAGSKNGPLKEPEVKDGDSGGSAGAGESGPGDEVPGVSDASGDSDSDSGWMVIAAINLTVFVLLIIGVVLLVSRAKRKKREREAQALAASRYPTGAQPPPFPGQQQPGPYAGHYPPPPGQGPPGP